MECSDLEKAIYRTLVYFAYFQFPLTFRELYTWLLAPERSYTEEEVNTCIETSSWLSDKTSRFGVYISLTTCRMWVNAREDRYIDAQRKQKKAQRFAAFLMMLPGVVGVAICNSLAWHATHAEGDIDFFVLTKPGRIWSVRLLATLPLRFLGMRPGEGAKDPFCLSFFVDETACDLLMVREGDEDWYLAYWVMSLQWIGGGRGIGERFIFQNAWARAVLPHALPALPISSLSARSLLKLPNIIPERWARYVQERMFPASIADKKNKGTHIIVNDHMLKFHEEDARASISAFVRLHMQQAGL